MKALYIIPARKGSKGIPNKNVKLLGGKALIDYSLACALDLADPEDICVSTDDERVVARAKSFGIPVPFMRPEALSTDEASMTDVLKHALDFYKRDLKRDYDLVVILQPTSPLRRAEQVKEALANYHPEMDMLASVKETDANPYYVLFEENEQGILAKSKTGNFKRRQDAPKIYQLNGAIYLINAKRLMEVQSLAEFKKVHKYQMDDRSSLDLDTPLDWEFAEFLLGR